MSETVDKTGENADQTAQGQHGEQAFEPITSQEQLDRLITARLARERAKFADYADLKEKAGRLDEIEQANKSELEKAQEQLAAETTARKASEAQLLRYQVAAEQGLDTKAAAFLQGSTREEMEQSAAQLTELIGTPRARVAYDASQGREQNPSAAGSSDWLRDAITHR